MSSWSIAAWLMLGGSMVLLFIGMPVALTFITEEEFRSVIHAKK
jgi:hypothetical protein